MQLDIPNCNCYKCTKELEIRWDGEERVKDYKEISICLGTPIDVLAIAKDISRDVVCIRKINKMIKLRELLDKYAGVYDDKEIIVEYFVQNNIEYEGMNLLISLAKSKASKVEKELDYIRSWIPVKIDMTKLYSCKEVGENLNQIITCQMCGLELPDNLLRWAKENIPDMELPQFMFMDTVKWLKEKYGIRFKDKEK